MNILYIEDEPNDAALVERYLKTTPHQFVHVSTLDAARLAFEPTPDLLLMDVMLEGSRVGYDFVHELRSQGYDQPIVAVTGLSMTHEIEECYKAGFTDVLVKPYAIKELATTISKYIV